MPRVLLVDDHAGFRAFARGLISAAGFVVVAGLGDGSAALSAAALHHPGLVVLDIRLPDMSGLDVARRLKAGPAAPVVILIPSGDRRDYVQVAALVLRRTTRFGAKERKNGKHPAVIARRALETQLREDAGDVKLDGLFADREGVSDTRV
jgi:CheY-like chemotaxis protein